MEKTGQVRVGALVVGCQAVECGQGCSSLSSFRTAQSAAASTRLDMDKLA